MKHPIPKQINVVPCYDHNSFSQLLTWWFSWLPYPCAYMHRAFTAGLRWKRGMRAIAIHVSHWVTTNLKMTFDANRGICAVQNWAYMRKDTVLKRNWQEINAWNCGIVSIVKYLTYWVTFTSWHILIKLLKSYQKWNITRRYPYIWWLRI